MGRLIDAELLIEALRDDDAVEWNWAQINSIIKEQPTVYAVPVVHGKWEVRNWMEVGGHGECVQYPKGALRCSNCSHAFKKTLLWKRNFCPNCGADMREVGK